MLKYPIVLLWSVILISFASCDEGKTVAPETETQQVDTTVYGNTGFRFPKLLPQADTIVKDWPIFKDFRGVSINFENSSIDDLKRKSHNLLNITDSLSRSLPDTLNNNMIISRLWVVKTRVELLEQEVNKGKPSPEQIANYIEEMQRATNNFVLQINEKIQKDQIDLGRKEDEASELRKQQRARDSIFTLELEDQSP